MDPGLAIVLATLVVTAGALARMGFQRRAARARIEALRSAERIEIEIVSTDRVSLLLAGVPGAAPSAWFGGWDGGEARRGIPVARTPGIR